MRSAGCNEQAQEGKGPLLTHASLLHGLCRTMCAAAVELTPLEQLTFKEQPRQWLCHPIPHLEGLQPWQHPHIPVAEQLPVSTPGVHQGLEFLVPQHKLQRQHRGKVTIAQNEGPGPAAEQF